MSGEELNFDEYDEIVNTAIKQIYRDNECIALQRIIKRQQKEIEELEKKYNDMISFNNDLLIQNKNSISKDKIRKLLQRYDKGIAWANADDHYYFVKFIKELLEENKSDENNI